MTYATGWKRSLPDFRDFTEATPDIQDVVSTVLDVWPANSKRVDFSGFCSPIEDQGGIGSCTSMALAGIIEYNQRKSFNKYINCSKLFMYKTTRNLLNETGDTGAYIRTAMKSLVLCGAPPEEYYPYIETDYDKEPSAFVYAMADNYKATKYFCLDPDLENTPPLIVLEKVKRLLRKEIPLMFGFYIFPSFEAGDDAGHIPFPGNEKAVGGHAIVAVGYDDEQVIENKQTGELTKGALLIRNSWGVAWGMNGYGWLPYAYVNNRIALDFWGLISMDWVDTEVFEL